MDDCQFVWVLASLFDGLSLLDGVVLGKLCISLSNIHMSSIRAQLVFVIMDHSISIIKLK